MNNLEDFIKGADVPNGKITNIYFINKNYRIYETDNLGNTMFITNDEINLNLTKNFKPLSIEFDSLLTSTNDRKKFALKKAMALADYFNGDIESGTKIMSDLIISIKRYKKLKSKLTYLLSAITFVIINMTIALLINTIWKENIDNNVIKLFTIMTFGSLGGSISIFNKISNFELDIDASFSLQVVEAVSRIFLSMISSLIIYIFISSDLILGIFNNFENPYILYTFSIISGFSENFIPSLIMKVKKESIEQ
jgi:hypothetical protein